MNVLSTVAQFLPTMLGLGGAVEPLIHLALAKFIPDQADDVERFAHTAMVALPALIGAGLDISSVADHTAGALRQMQAEGRGPSEAKWKDQETRIKALEAQWQAATQQDASP